LIEHWREMRIQTNAGVHAEITLPREKPLRTGNVTPSKFGLLGSRRCRRIGR
jgi:hypothetical protein